MEDSVPANSIIIVEDDEDDIEFLNEIFFDLGCINHYIVLTDGKSAYDFLKEKKLRKGLIICDINLPKISDLDLKMKLDDSTTWINKEIPFIFLTAAIDQFTLVTARSLSSHGAYVKTSSYKDLVKLFEDFIAIASL